MKKYYFMYGRRTYPFKGGWTEVRAGSNEEAIQIFTNKHQSGKYGNIPCQRIYDECAFDRTDYRTKGYHGHGCWEKLTA